MVTAAQLLASAQNVIQNAHAPFSHFRVGVALAARDGRIFTGCNIESSSYGLTICAERVAFFKAISEGARDFQSLLIITSSDELCPPCGACRQVIWDFAPALEIILVNNRHEQKSLHIAELFPLAFGQQYFMSAANP